MPPPPGEYIALGESLAGPLEDISRQNIADSRARLQADRERIYQANPSLRPRETQYSNAVGEVGDMPTLGRCGMPRSEVTDAKRRLTHAEASKSPSFSYPFQTTSQVVAEYNSTGAQGCDAIRMQFQASMSSFNAAMSSADTLYNAPSPGAQCDPSSGGAASASYCAATALLYQAQTVAALCHAVCN